MALLKESDIINTEVAANKKSDCSKAADANVIYNELQELTNFQETEEGKLMKLERAIITKSLV